jgi:hypothetical protein
MGKQRSAGKAQDRSGLSLLQYTLVVAFAAICVTALTAYFAHVNSDLSSLERKVESLEEKVRKLDLDNQRLQHIGQQWLDWEIEERCKRYGNFDQNTGECKAEDGGVIFRRDWR